jgi:hypothetical protein
MDTASEPTLRRGNRDTIRVARNDATPQIAQFAGFVTPSPPDGGRRRHEDTDFSPNGPTPAAARVISYNNGADSLNAAEQKAVEELMQKYGPDDRCLITQEKVYNFCHLVARSTPSRQVCFPFAQVILLF